MTLSMVGGLRKSSCIVAQDNSVSAKKQLANWKVDVNSLVVFHFHKLCFDVCGGPTYYFKRARYRGSLARHSQKKEHCTEIIVLLSFES